MKIYLASTNMGKVREFNKGGQAARISVEALPGLGSLPSCIEDGKSFEENARKKALHYSQLTAGLVFADDSGICVTALGGAPGIYSARYSGPEADDVSNNQKLLSELSRLGSPDRSAEYVCVIALAEHGKLLTLVEDRARGLILETPRGAGGFGYDPLFYFPPLGKTFAELSPEEKFKVSHRGKAFCKLLKFLATLERKDLSSTSGSRF